VPDAMPQTAMVLAAGLGTRMRSHRDDIPKPLVPIAGRSLIDRVLDKLVEAAVPRAVINISYMGDKIKQHLEGRHDLEIVFSHEDEPLETGGGIMHALHLLGDAPFYVINADTLWLDGPLPALPRMAKHYEPERMDTLLLACPLQQTTGYEGQGDFILNEKGQVRRPSDDENATHVFAGVQILDPTILAPFQKPGAPKKFSLNQLFHASLDTGWFERIYALEHDSTWMHVGDATGVHEAELKLAA